MLEKKIRPALELVLAPVSKSLLKVKHFSPILAAISTVASGLLVLPLMLLNLHKLALGMLWLSYFLSQLSGMITAANEPINRVNVLYDVLADRLVDFIIIFGFYLLNPGIIAWISMLILVSNLIAHITHLVIGILSQPSDWQLLYQSPGLMDRLELWLVFSIMLVWPLTYGVLGVVLAISLLCTAAMRVFEFQRV